jgi:MSHA biogenesis protein MshE
MARQEKVRLGDLLVNAKLITQEQLESALAQQRGSGRRLGRVLVDNKFISEVQISEALAKQFDIVFIDLKRYNLDPDLVRLLPEDQARRYRSIVLDAHEGVITVGMADPPDQSAIDEVSRLLKHQIAVVVVTEGQVLESIDRGYRRTDDIGGQMYGRTVMAGREPSTTSTGNHSEASAEVSVSKQIQAIFETALRERASDVHIERHDKTYSHRLRVDGVLVSGIALPYKITEGLALRLKLMAELDIVEKRLPLSGRFHVRVGERAVEVRISVCPVGNGESMVLHLSAQDEQRTTLDSLGMPELMVARLREILARGKGMLLLTGPAGSGKSTTLLAALAELDADNLKIVSVENPIEHQDSKHYQLQVDVLGGLDFSAAVQAALHQDPDVLVLHEMPNGNVLHSALHAAIDGKKVFAAMNGYDAVSALCQFNEHGLPRFMAVSAVQAVLAQHLLRRVCGHCGALHTLTHQELAWLNMEGLSADQLGVVKHGKGCVQCHGTGFHGRIAVFELLEMRQALVDAAAHDSASAYMSEAAKQLQGKRLTEQALRLAQQGQTSLSEVIRLSNRHPA